MDLYAISQIGLGSGRVGEFSSTYGWTQLNLTHLLIGSGIIISGLGWVSASGLGIAVPNFKNNNQGKRRPTLQEAATAISPAFQRNLSHYPSFPFPPIHQSQPQFLLSTKHRNKAG